MGKSSKQKSDTPTIIPQDYSWVETTVWNSRMLVALVNGVKGDKWFSLIDKVYSLKSLTVAWRKVKSNRGSAGIDKISIERFEQNCEYYLEELSKELQSGSLKPLPVRRVYIPKASGGKRPLGIPAVKDRVVQMSLKQVLEPIFEQKFSEISYGFRPGRGAKDALRSVNHGLRQGYNWVVDADIKGYFDNIDHDMLMQRIERHISDGRLLKLIRTYLEHDVMDDGKLWTSQQGTPQGAVLSPLLANIYLDDLDKIVGKEHRMVRYADDFIILCKTREEAEYALVKVREWMEVNKLELHPTKTKIINENDDDDGFDFLGYNFKQGRRAVKKSSYKALRAKIKLMTRRTQGVGLDVIIKALNPILRGWFEYFKHVKYWVFQKMDSFVRRRLRSILRRYNKQSKGTGRCLNDHCRWPNIFFAERGLFTMSTAHALASKSR